MPAILRRLFLYGNVIIAAGLICSAFLPMVNPASFWPAGFAGLAFPLLWVLSVIFIPGWLIVRKKYWLISVFALIVSFRGIGVTWGFNLFNTGKTHTAQSFTVMSFNSSSMGLLGYKETPRVREHIYQIVREARPDVLCIQEFYTNEHPDQQPHLENILSNGAYPYYYFAEHYTQWTTWHYGTAIFSRFPIIDTARIAFNGGYKGNEDLLKVKLLVHGDTVQVLTGHLSSYRLNGKDYQAVGSPDGGKIKSVMGKMRRSFANRVTQAQIMAAEISKSQYPLVVTGDFNDIPLSYTYRTIRGNALQDAFLEQGSGFGRTFSALSPTLRIDYVLPGREFAVEDFSIFRKKGLQHFPVMARLSLKH
ncbi:endonuclease/exonuclease/phosphatase family protein [Chitinophaga barathri]|uniref:Endonuclease/exonuclease/phosphatase domain-containing protein n=1 Tax=Chitinophaga barathri TaxID=1647451 RepID=A0A3N4MAB3_9BACT|nr:endonuclease/exonuclease/phosphatase family protein [Chitinophaga barathri]RPD40295.1 hypothetical protein EG028_16755 [Chitinophaga barathri]